MSSPGWVAAGYAPRVGEDDVHAWRFERLVDQATTAADPDERLALLRDALALWRGPVPSEYVGHDRDAR